MRILLIGEYSLLHNSLKEGLVQLGHEVILAANSDGFKNYPVDLDFEAKWSKFKSINILRQIIFRLFKYDFATLEYGIRIYFLLPKNAKFPGKSARLEVQPWQKWLNVPFPDWLPRMNNLSHHQ